MNHFNFISAEVIISEIKQELNSYFDSGSVKETLIPTHINAALRKLGILSLEQKEVMLPINHFLGYLPKDFMYVKDAFLCTESTTVTQATPHFKNKYYKRVDCDGDCGPQVNEMFEVWEEYRQDEVITHSKPKLLRVHFGSKSYCASDCKGINQLDSDEIKIYDKKIHTTFDKGNIIFKYYSQPFDEFGPLIPEVVEIEEYIKYYIGFKLFEQLWNSVSDESVNIIERKLQYYKQNYMGKYESALNTLKTQSRQQLRDSIARQSNRYIKYYIN